MSVDNRVSQVIFRSPGLVLPGEQRGLIVVDLRHSPVCVCKMCLRRRMPAVLPLRRVYRN